jgi:hypothetical protein
MTDTDNDNQVESMMYATSSPCTIQYHMPKFRDALKWQHFLPCIRTPK